MHVAEIKKKKRFSGKLKAAIAVLIIIILALLTFLFFREPEPANLIVSPSIHFPEPLESGIYSEPFNLQFSFPEKGDVYYSNDGTVPRPPLWSKYEGSIMLDSSTSFSGQAWIRTSPRWKAPLEPVEFQPALRFVVSYGDSVSQVVNRHYFIKKHKVPLVSIIADPDSLFGFEKGIYVMGKKYEDKDNYARDKIPLTVKWWEYPANYNERGVDWERKVSLFTTGTRLGTFTSENAGLRVHGSATRGLAQKSLRVYFNDTAAPFAVVLRNGGNDWDHAFIRDVFMQKIYSRITPIHRKGEPVQVYFNGNYWGLHNLREYQDHHYIASLISGNPQHVTMLDVNLEHYRGASVPDHLKTFFKRVNEFSAEKNNTMDSIGKYLDIINFTDYLIYNIYYSNTDWPHNNFRVWTYSPPGTDTSRWHFLPTDHDFAAGFNGASAAAQLNMLESTANSKTFTGDIFRQLLKDARYRALFRERFESQLRDIYEEKAQQNVLDSLIDIYEPFMEQHINRWSTHFTMEQWKREISEIEEFIRLRNSRQTEHLREFFGKFED